MNNLKKLPIGISSFTEMIEDNYIYVDKTKDIYNLINTGKTYFLSRPRRFGKSLLVSTSEQIFLGNKELFKNLWIYNSDYDWRKYPVISLNFGNIAHGDKQELIAELGEELEAIAEKYNIKDIEIQSYSVSGKLKKLIRQLAKINKVVILIDEYDKPILDSIDNEEISAEFRDILRSLFETIKNVNENVEFTFLTGVTKFAHTSIFCGFNIAQDITLSKKAETLLGYTQEELQNYFSEYLNRITQEQNISLDSLLKEIKCWYNGYLFTKIGTKVYNPFSVLNYLENKSFDNFWFSTGTPSFLVKLIKLGYYELEDLKDLKFEKDDLGSFELDNIYLPVILFQAGYLTISHYDSQTNSITLGYPNFEVERSFKRYLLGTMANIAQPFVKNELLKIAKTLETNNLDKFRDILEMLLAQIPYTLTHPKESAYHIALQTAFSLLCMEANSEILTHTGRIDLVAITKKYIYIFELKFNSSPEAALKQIEDRKYAQKYQSEIYKDKKIILVGLNFDISKKDKSLFINYLTKEI